MKRAEWRSFFKMLLVLAIPIVLQDILLSALNLIDTVMIGRVGSLRLSAVSLCNQYYFVFLLFCYGLGSGAMIMMSQFWGKGDKDGMRSAMGLLLLLVIAGGALFSAMASLFPREIIRLFTADVDVINYGERYFRVVSPSYIFTGVSIAYSMGLRSAGNTRPPFYTAGIALAINIFLNWVFIFGNLGFAAMGVSGAALATLIARGIEMVAIVGWIYLRRYPAAVRLGDVRRWTRPFRKRLLSLALPVMTHEIVWAIGFSVYKMVYARMGTDILSAHAIVEPIFRLSFVFIIGSSNAGAVIIGNAIGKKRLDLAQEYGMAFLPLGAAQGIVIGIIIAVMSGFVVSFYNVGSEIQDLARRSLLALILAMPFKGSVLHIVVAVLRGGGDNRYNMIIDLVSTYFVGVPLAIVGGLVLKLSLPSIYLLLTCVDLVILAATIGRIRSRRWIHEVTHFS